MIVDGFTYLGKSRQGWSVDRQELLDALDSESVEAAVVCPTHPHGHSFQEANDLVAAAAAKSKRLIGLARVDPLESSDAVGELERAARQLSLRGLFLHPWEDSYSLARAEVSEVVAGAEALGLPVMIAAAYPWVAEATQITGLCQRFPDVRFVVTSGGQINISGLGQIDAANLVARCPNVVLLTNGVYRDDFLCRVIEELGPERLGYGSSYPLMDMRFERRRVARSRLPRNARSAVLGETIAGLYGVTAEHKATR